MCITIIKQYFQEQSLIRQKIIQSDQKQLQIIPILDNLQSQVLQYHQSWKDFNQGQTQQQESQQSLYNSLFSQSVEKVDDNKSLEYIKGIYLYGTPGCGKTYLMDLFYDSLPIEEKERVHFNEFMLEIQKQVHKMKLNKVENPLQEVAQQKAKSTRVLCLDEFQVTDICDALILKNLFESFLNNNIVILATSNRPPDDLYKGGLQRFLFEPFIPFLKQKCEIIDIDSNVDYRYCQETDVNQRIQTFLSPVDEASDNYLNDVFHKLSQKVYEGRKLLIRKQQNGVAMFEYDELCQRTLGSSDFLAIARHFKYIIVKNVPIINTFDRNAVRRFILLIDEIYNNKTKLFISAQMDLNNLFQKYEDKVHDEQFALERTHSRIVEMQSKKYQDEECYYDKKNN